MAMDASAVRKIVQDNIQRMRNAMYLNAWRLNFHYIAIDDGSYAQARLQPEYKIADITINPEVAEDEESVLDSLRHELIHVMLAPIDLFRDQVEALLDEKTFKAVQLSYTSGLEQTVGQIEAALEHGLHIPVKEMGKLKPKSKPKPRRKKK